MVLRFRDRAWNWGVLGSKVPLSVVLELPDKPWDFRDISQNPHLTADFIGMFPSESWNWVSISSNSCVSMSLIEAFCEKNWSWFNISSNDSITMEVVLAHIDKPWSWSGLSENPNLTLEMITSFPDKPWDFGAISKHSFTVDRKNYVRRATARLCLLTILDEDYHRCEDELDLSKAIDLVFQNEFIISRMIQYL